MESGSAGSGADGTVDDPAADGSAAGARAPDDDPADGRATGEGCPGGGRAAERRLVGGRAADGRAAEDLAAEGPPPDGIASLIVFLNLNSSSFSWRALLPSSGRTPSEPVVPALSLAFGCGGSSSGFITLNLKGPFTRDCVSIDGRVPERSWKKGFFNRIPFFAGGCVPTGERTIKRSGGSGSTARSLPFLLASSNRSLPPLSSSMSIASRSLLTAHSTSINGSLNDI